jgi:type II secretory pathway component GspD/PulD (secretin)
MYRTHPFVLILFLLAITGAAGVAAVVTPTSGAASEPTRANGAAAAAPPDGNGPVPNGTVDITPSNAGASRLFDIDSFQSDVSTLLKSLAVQSGANIIIIGSVSSRATVSFHQMPLDRAIDLLTKAAGLTYIKDGDAYVVGAAKDIVAEYPTETPLYDAIQKVYVCKYVSANTLATALLNVYDKNLLRVTIGAIERSTRLQDSSSDQGTTGSSSSESGGTAGSAGGPTSSSSSAVGGGSSPSTGGGSTSTGLESRDLILSGEEAEVTGALALAEELDKPRKQIKIEVNITDVSLDNLKNLGVQWNIPQFSVPSSTPVGFQATLTALENDNKAKELAAPTISLLDGESGYILIGQRIEYPVLTGYSQAQTPIFSVGQEEVGIYLQVTAEMSGDDDIMLSVFPQVSFITGYLNINGASYPQVSTREQQTTIRVHDGGQIVIGGLISDEELRDDQSVPILSSIPFFGELFKYRNKEKSRDEVIMTITPTVIPD